MRSKAALVLSVAALFLALTTARGLAEEKARTIRGEGACAKCSLKETSACQNAIKVKEGNKTVTYYLVHNQVSKDFHPKICTSTAKVVATGTVKEANGKMEMTPTKIELDK
jgi:hypothetical protein